MAVDEIDGWVDRWSEIDVLLETKPLILCQHEEKDEPGSRFRPSGHCWRCSPVPTSSTSLKASILRANGRER